VLARYIHHMLRNAAVAETDGSHGGGKDLLNTLVRAGF
jgi:hypothetical protein